MSARVHNYELLMSGMVLITVDLLTALLEYLTAFKQCQPSHTKMAL